MKFGSLNREGSSLCFLGRTKRQLKTCLDEVDDNSIQEFTVANDSFTDRFLEILLERQIPVSFILEHTHISEIGVGHIVDKCRDCLKKLSLFGGDQVGKDGIRRLSECGKLVSLNVGYTNLDGLDLQFLARKLKELNVSGLDLGYDEIAIVCRYSNLHYFRGDDLGSCSEALFVTLNALPNLRYLYLDRCDLQDQDFILVDRYQKLRTLSVASNDITTNGVAELSEIPSLTSLNLNNNFRIGCEGNNLCLPEGLTELEVDYCNISDRSIESISKCSRLKRLSLASNLDITHRGLSQLLALSRLATLSLSELSLGNLEFNVIEKMKALETLDLEYTNLEARDLYRLAANSTVRRLMIQGTPAANDAIALKDLKNRFTFVNMN